MEVDKTFTDKYDAFDHRVYAQRTSGTEEYVFDPSGLRTSTWQMNGQASGTGVDGRIYWDGGLVAHRSEHGTFFHHTNVLGTERQRTNQSGAIVDFLSSFAYGDGASESNSDKQGAAEDNNQFTSQEYDSETNTIHFQYRQYASTQGRWMSPDPYAGSYSWKNPQSLNRYTYVLNNPFSLTDPSGLLCQGAMNNGINPTTGQVGGVMDPQPGDEATCAANGGTWTDDGASPDPGCKGSDACVSTDPPTPPVMDPTNCGDCGVSGGGGGVSG